jgi:hypothetical protein
MKKDQKHSTVEFQTNPSKKAESSEKSGEFFSPFLKSIITKPYISRNSSIFLPGNSNIKLKK